MDFEKARDKAGKEAKKMNEHILNSVKICHLPNYTLSILYEIVKFYFVMPTHWVDSIAVWG